LLCNALNPAGPHLLSFWLLWLDRIGKEIELASNGWLAIRVYSRPIAKEAVFVVAHQTVGSNVANHHGPAKRQPRNGSDLNRPQLAA
jgi:hypothetical protein